MRRRVIHKPMIPMIAMIALAIVATVIGLVGYLRPPSDSWEMAAAIQLRQLHQAMVVYASESGAPPPSAFSLIRYNYISSELVLLPGSDRSLDDVRLGGMTGRDLVRLPEAEARALLSEPAVVQGGWEAFGDFYLVGPSLSGPRPPRSWQESFNSGDIIVAVSVTSPDAPDVRVACFADNSTATLVGDGWLDEQNERRARLNMPLIELPPR